MFNLHNYFVMMASNICFIRDLMCTQLKTKKRVNNQYFELLEEFSTGGFTERVREMSSAEG